MVKSGEMLYFDLARVQRDSESENHNEMMNDDLVNDECNEIAFLGCALNLVLVCPALARLPSLVRWRSSLQPLWNKWTYRLVAGWLHVLCFWPATLFKRPTYL